MKFRKGRNVAFTQYVGLDGPVKFGKIISTERDGYLIDVTSEGSTKRTFIFKDQIGVTCLFELENIWNSPLAKAMRED